MTLLLQYFVDGEIDAAPLGQQLFEDLRAVG